MELIQFPMVKVCLRAGKRLNGKVLSLPHCFHLYFLLVEQICSEDLLQSALRGKVSTKPSIHRFRSQRSMKQQKNVSEVTLDSSWPFVSCSTVAESHHQGWQLYTTPAPSSVPSFCLLSSGVTINVSPLSQQDMNF